MHSSGVDLADVMFAELRVQGGALECTPLHHTVLSTDKLMCYISLEPRVFPKDLKTQGE